MKALISIIVITLFVSSGLFAQKGKWQDDELRVKFEELEKIKLIEVLQMDEETTLRFFARQSEHKKQQDEIQDIIRTVTDNMEILLKGDKTASNEELKSKIDEINKLQLQLEKNRVDFINSLPDILSYEQIAQLIIFEKRFRNEVRKMIMKDRRPPMGPEQH